MNGLVVWNWGGCDGEVLFEEKSESPRVLWFYRGMDILRLMVFQSPTLTRGYSLA